MKNLRENGGITLVALVITIIILIILAGITISMVLGENGLIGRAKQGGEDYKLAAQAEQDTLKNVNEQVNDILNGTGSTTPTSLTAADISFTPDDSNWHVSTVAQALDYLYGN